MKNESDFERGVYIAGLIEKYLQHHPKAMDDFEGIRDWWVTHQKLYESSYSVNYALELLIKKGVVEKTSNNFYRYANK